MRITSPICAFCPYGIGGHKPIPVPNPANFLEHRFWTPAGSQHLLGYP